MKQYRLLVALMLVYGFASLLHFVHNAQFLEAYPNMPVWLSPLRVYLAWAAVAAVGVAGYVLLRRGFVVVGLVTISVYAALGLDGLGHYSLAPMMDHSLGMNLSIWFEVIMASVLLVAVAATFFRLKAWQR